MAVSIEDYSIVDQTPVKMLKGVVSVSQAVVGYTWPYPQEADRYIQKVWDPAVGGSGAWVVWESYGYADASGIGYPHGQTQYAGTSGYRVIGIFHNRSVT